MSKGGQGKVLGKTLVTTAQEAYLGACRHHFLEMCLLILGPRRLSHYGLSSPALWLGALRSQGVAQSPVQISVEATLTD